MRTSPAPAAPPKVMGALTVMLVAAVSVSAVPAVHEMASATVILPACPPPEPVETVTFAPARAVCSVSTLMMLSSAPALKPPVSVPFEIVTLYGSSSSVPKLPWAAERSVKPV